ncbi:hypothetical protein [Thaumasiovibrio subtropicus]|uniref:hypothetical protein n=1 Tax=Thaumasiovibrio subtropicus TaxID=1891207 RepID=UPI000B360A89|nr:hypothetical protein [Thaumasiovibrio subtropicus]
MFTGKLPSPADGVQLNFCKTLACRNFGLEDEQHYVLQQSNPSRPAMVCRECGAFPPLLSNQEVINEARRQIVKQQLVCCTNPDCHNNMRPAVLHRDQYHHFGYSGNKQRFRCKACKTTFVDPFSQSNPHAELHLNLLNKLYAQEPVRDICRDLALNPKSFYHHLQLIAARCNYHNAIYQHALIRQTRPSELSCVLSELQPGSYNGVDIMTVCDEQSGFILSQSTNYAAAPTPPDHGTHNAYIDDCHLLPTDSVYSMSTTPHQWPEQLLARVDDRYRQIMARKNVEEPLHQNGFKRYPANGSLIRSQYMVYGHFLRLKPLLSHWPIELYLPQEPLIRSAVVSVFKEEVANQQLNPIYVDQSGTPPNEHKKIDIVLMGWWRDRWAFSHGDDGSKGICHLGGATGDEAHLLQRARTAANHQYIAAFRAQFSVYLQESRRVRHPSMLVALSQIFRAGYNLSKQDNNPVVRAGLAKTPLSFENLLRHTDMQN